ncbi:Palmitoyltransferase, partial [Spiromyces aspiralis]
MDHHCPWVNNCIGHYNHGHFLRFIYSVDVTCSIALAIHSCRMYELVIDVINNTYPARQPTQTEVTFLILNISLLLLVLIFVGALSVYHVILIVSNTTSIERKERKRVQRLVEKRQIPPCEYPYDLGVVDNLKSLFGNNILLWWVPKAMKGHGLDFPIKKGLEPPVYWPPPGYHVQAGPNAYPGEVSNILYKGKGGGMMVTAEIDDDGET